MSEIQTNWSTGYTPSGSSTERKFRGWLNYTYTNTNATTATIAVYCGAELNHSATCSFAVTRSVVKNDDTTQTNNGTASITYGGTAKATAVSSTTFTYTRGHSNVTKRLTVTAKGSTGTPSTWQSETLTKYVDVTIQAKPSYAVSYNANGGSGTISNQKKWYGENLTLASSGFTRANYTLKRWNTKADGTGTNYALGATYTGNAALTLYAVWELNAVVIKTKVSGAWKSGIFYAKISGIWKMPFAGYVKVSGVWKQIKP